jgi:hypothetical protein
MNLDLDLNNYSLDDLFKLFNISNLDEKSLKNAKQIVYKMHPDKSKLDPKYFLFFSKSYKRLYGIYEFKNKEKNNKIFSEKNEDYFDESNKEILDNLFSKNNKLKDPKHFNKWLNDKFEKHRIDSPNDYGHGDWLKSNDGFINLNDNVNITKENMHNLIEQKKKQMQDISVYNGIQESYSNSLGGSLLDNSENDFSNLSNDLTTNIYTDLKSAYTQTLIPVTNDDYENITKFNSLSEYKQYRNSINTTPLNKEDAIHQLDMKQRESENYSNYLAYKYVIQSEKIQQHQNQFWGDMRLLTNSH